MSEHLEITFGVETLIGTAPAKAFTNCNASTKEQRFYALGQADRGRWLFVAFTMRVNAKAVYQNDLFAPARDDAE